MKFCKIAYMIDVEARRGGDRGLRLRRLWIWIRKGGFHLELRLWECSLSFWTSFVSVFSLRRSSLREIGRDWERLGERDRERLREIERDDVDAMAAL